MHVQNFAAALPRALRLGLAARSYARMASAMHCAPARCGPPRCSHAESHAHARIARGLRDAAIGRAEVGRRGLERIASEQPGRALPSRSQRPLPRRVGEKGRRARDVMRRAPMREGRAQALSALQVLPLQALDAPWAAGSACPTLAFAEACAGRVQSTMAATPSPADATQLPRAVQSHARVAVRSRLAQLGIVLHAAGREALRAVGIHVRSDAQAEERCAAEHARDDRTPLDGRHGCGRRAASLAKGSAGAIACATRTRRPLVVMASRSEQRASALKGCWPVARLGLDAMHARLDGHGHAEETRSDGLSVDPRRARRSRAARRASAWAPECAAREAARRRPRRHVLVLLAERPDRRRCSRRARPRAVPSFSSQRAMWKRMPAVGFTVRRAPKLVRAPPSSDRRPRPSRPLSKSSRAAAKARSRRRVGVRPPNDAASTIAITPTRIQRRHLPSATSTGTSKSEVLLAGGAKRVEQTPEATCAKGPADSKRSHVQGGVEARARSPRRGARAARRAFAATRVCPRGEPLARVSSS